MQGAVVADSAASDIWSVDCDAASSTGKVTRKQTGWTSAQSELHSTCKHTLFIFFSWGYFSAGSTENI